MKSQIVRNSAGLQAAMFEELEALRAGTSTPQTARAVAALANTACTLARLEMDYARFVNSERASETTGLNSLPMGKLESV